MTRSQVTLLCLRLAALYLLEKATWLVPNFGFVFGQRWEASRMRDKGQLAPLARPRIRLTRIHSVRTLYPASSLLSAGSITIMDCSGDVENV